MPKTATHLTTLRHSTEHLLMYAMQEQGYPILPAMGPATDQGFYFDFELMEGGLTENDFLKIEAEMKKLVEANLVFIREERSLDELRALFRDNPYKREWLAEIEQKSQTTASIYWIVKEGTNVAALRENLLQDQKPDVSYFVDLCTGPHVSRTQELGVYKLLSIAGAYWRGNEKNKMLTRIYGTAFPTPKELDHFLWQQEEAKKRDHRLLGQQLEIFTFADEVGAGLPLWLPNGTIVRDELEKWARATERKWGYQRVATPHITKKDLYEISGHLPYYADDLYAPIDIEGEQYYLKPMNCPHTHMIYKSRKRSYRELPLRLAEYGQVYRFERSGTLHGLMRVRGFCQNDAHIYVQPEKAVAEFLSVLEMHRYYYETLGIQEWWVVLGLRDPANLRQKYHGDDEMWQKAETLTKEALNQAGVRYEIEEGGAAHYGPKADIYIKSVIGKTYAIGTDQLDLYMPQQFKLTYTDQKGQEQMPYIIHRAPLGSHERLIGFLLEHFAGALPVWLHPVQVQVIPVSEKTNAYAHKITQQLLGADIRVTLDVSNAMLNHKIRDAQLQKIPYMIIVGPQEEKTDQISVRVRSQAEKRGGAVTEFISQLKEKILTRTLEV